MKVVTRKEVRLSHQGGFNMIEVLVTLAVLSVGLLGVAALQSIGIKFNHQSYQRTQAVVQAFDIVERMRANRACIDPLLGFGCAYDDLAPGNIPLGPPNCISSDGVAACAARTDIATYDVAQWNTANAQMLTNGRGAICRGVFNAALNCGVGAATVRTWWVVITWTENDLNMRIDVPVNL